ncbi:MAG: ATP-binding protein [Lachnospiraceae bacterium]|nr:ATP-binding protein [Lachnospiraceae bacterium]
MNSTDRHYKYLEGLYLSGGQKTVVLYGHKYTGKKSLIERFTKDKPSVSYTASKCEDRQQRRIMGKRFFADRGIQGAASSHETRSAGPSAAGSPAPENEEYPEYREIFAKMAENARDGRLVISIFDFEHLIRPDSDFLKSLIDFAESGTVYAGLMILLVSGSVGFVENDLLKKSGMLSRSVTAFLKFSDCAFSELSEHFPGWSAEDRIGVYAILGGRPGLYGAFDVNVSLKENVEKVILDKYGALRNEAELRLSRSLREPAVYSSILMSIASGDRKLNDIYRTTGFSRAKISVYIENLMAFEAAQKVFSEETKGMENAKKGIYAVSDPLLLFWYRYVFPHLSELLEMTAEEFYEEYIEEDFPSFCEQAFRDAVSQYIVDSSLFPGAPGRFGIWDGKKGKIDLLAERDDGSWTAGLCSYEKGVMDEDMYRAFLATVKSARIQVSHTVLAAREGFSPELLKLGDREDVTLITLKDIS